MAVLLHDCPHCGGANSSFLTVASYQNPLVRNGWNVYFACPACHGPICAMLLWTGGDPKGYSGNIRGREARSSYLQQIEIYPAPEAIEVPESLPDMVARAFAESAQARKARLFSIACAGYRRAMELALKEFAPDVEAWKLEKRIDKLAAENRITPTLQEWAHRLRLDGNEAIHGDGEADEALCTQMHELTRFLLLYLYTLPSQVEQARRAGEA